MHHYILNSILCDTANMRARLIIILFACLLTQSLCRPQQMDYNNENNIDGNVDEDEEDDNEPAADETLADDEDTRLDDQETAVQEDEEPQLNRRSSESRYLQRDAAEERPTRTNADFPDYKPTNRDANSKYLFRMPMKTRQTDDASDQQEAAQHLTNRDVNTNREENQRDNQNVINKRTIELNGSLNEEGDMIFQNNKEPKSNADKHEHNNNDALDASEQSRYLKQYYNTMQAENKAMGDDKNLDSAHYNLRDRRETKEPNEEDTLASQSRKANLDKTSEDEESAIKRHIKKLSGDELEQLLNSLSEEKRELLKKIINDSDLEDNAYVNKREITKKSGAIDDNSFVETAQSDLSKVQSGASVDINSESSATPNTETTEATKPTPESRTDSNDVSSSKTADTNNLCDSKAELTKQNEEVIQKKSDVNTFSSSLDSKNQAEIATNILVTSKTENKRETNLYDQENMNLPFDDTAFLNSDSNLKDELEYSNDEGYFCSDDNVSQFLDDQAKYHNEDSKTYKRETDLRKQSDLDESMKSLEESFPNSEAYGASGPYSGPLVRVKRRNSDQIIKKRSAVLLPDAKVAYFPYKAENEDEDNDEGSEFDDEGFYDRTSNFAINKAVEDESSGNSEKSKQPQRTDSDESEPSNDHLESDTMSLGSDTDSVLSGVEGVDENLMYNSGRNIRAAEEISRKDTKLSKFLHPTSLIDDIMKTQSENANVPHYQENDAFGPLPRSYEGDLGRYKRIRRVKQSRNSDDPSSDMSE